MASLFCFERRYKEAEPSAQRARAILEKDGGPDYPDLAANLRILAQIRSGQGRYEEAEPLLKRFLQITTAARGPADSVLVPGLSSYADVLRKMSRKAEASRVEMQLRAISGK
jgi:tetratricopeptide (TPR) repeat protein